MWAHSRRRIRMPMSFGKKARPRIGPFHFYGLFLPIPFSGSAIFAVKFIYMFKIVAHELDSITCVFRRDGIVDVGIISVSALLA